LTWEISPFKADKAAVIAATDSKIIRL